MPTPGPEIFFILIVLLIIPVILYFWFSVKKEKKNEARDFAELTASELVEKHGKHIIGDAFLYAIWKNRSAINDSQLVIRNEKDEHVATIDVFYRQRKPFRVLHYNGKHYDVDNITGGKLYGVAVRNSDQNEYQLACQNHLIKTYFYQGHWQHKKADNVKFYGHNYHGFMNDTGHFYSLDDEEVARIKFINEAQRSGAMIISAKGSIDTMQQLFILCAKISSHIAPNSSAH